MGTTTAVPVEVGDLVQWDTGQRARVGVVKSLNPDGTATLSLKKGKASVEEKIKTSRLVRIISTIKSEPKRE